MAISSDTTSRQLLEVDEEEQVAHFETTRPTFKQLRNSISAKLAYDDLFEAKG